MVRFIPGFLGRLSRVPQFLSIFALVLALCGLAWGAYKVFFELAPPVFSRETVQRGDVEASVRASGQIRPVREVEVGTLASGQLMSLKVKLGERVQRDQLLAEIDPSLVENEVRRTRALLDEERARLRIAQIQLKLNETIRARAQALRRSDAGSQDDLDRADADCEKQQALIVERKAAMLRAEILLDDARTRLSQTKITAPIDGEVIALKILEGQTVVATQTAQVILVLADLTTVTVAAQVSEADITHVGVGQSAYFSVLAEPDRRQAGVIREIEPSPVKKTGEASRAIYYQALFDVENTDSTLRPMMTADVTIVSQRAQQALTVPVTALRDPEAKRDAEVAVLDQAGHPSWRKVRLGVRSDTRVAVTEGLREGEVVISDQASALGKTGGEAA